MNETYQDLENGYIEKGKTIENCLIYALAFSNLHPEYEIWHNSDHCINIPKSVNNPFPNKEFLRAEEFGYSYFLLAFQHVFLEYPGNYKLLQNYFKIKN